MPVALGAIVVLLVAARPKVQAIVLGNEECHQQGEQHGACAKQEGRPRDYGALVGVRQESQSMKPTQLYTTSQAENLASIPIKLY